VQPDRVNYFLRVKKCARHLMNPDLDVYFLSSFCNVKAPMVPLLQIREIPFLEKENRQFTTKSGPMAIGAPDGKIALSIKEDQRIHCR
jgi:hypothetical protein